MKSAAQILDGYTQVRMMATDKVQSLYARTLNRWGEFCLNPIATTSTFLLAIALVIFLALTSGCASTPGQSLDTFNKKLAAGYVSVTTARQVTIALLDNRKISVDDARNIETQLNNAREALDIAKTTHSTNPNVADSKLQATLTAIAALQAYLASKGNTT